MSSSELGERVVARIIIERSYERMLERLRIKLDECRARTAEALHAHGREDRGPAARAACTCGRISAAIPTSSPTAGSREGVLCAPGSLFSPDAVAEHLDARRRGDLPQRNRDEVPAARDGALIRVLAVGGPRIAAKPGSIRITAAYKKGLAMFSASAKRSLLVVAVQRHADARSLLEERRSASRAADMMASTALEGALDIVAWPGYIERGETDKAYDWVSQFEGRHRLQGQRQDRRHLGRNGVAHDQGGPQPSPPGDASWPPAGNAPTTSSPPRVTRRCG